MTRPAQNINPVQIKLVEELGEVWENYRHRCLRDSFVNRRILVGHLERMRNLCCAGWSPLLRHVHLIMNKTAVEPGRSSISEKIGLWIWPNESKTTFISPSLDPATNKSQFGSMQRHLTIADGESKAFIVERSWRCRMSQMQISPRRPPETIAYKILTFNVVVSCWCRLG